MPVARRPRPFRVPGYPLTPIVFILVMAGFVASAVAYRPAEPLIGMALGATGGLVFMTMRRPTA